jgi:UDPglucose 6-dehydrogenase
LGHSATCVDTDSARIDLLCKGRVPIHEPALNALIARNLRTGQLSFSTSLETAGADAQAIFIAVGTPDSGDGRPDLSAVFSVARQISRASSGCCVVIKSTVPVGTADAVEKIFGMHLPYSFDVVSNPEFLREGSAVHDFLHPQRIVVGADTESARAVMAKIYDPTAFGGAPVVYTGRRTAELAKYAANGFLAAKISYINDLSDLCECLGANVEEVSRVMGLDSRIGREFLRPGPGYGGSCLPKDTRALAQMARDCGAPAGVFEAIDSANQLRKERLVRRVAAACGDALAGRKIAVLGLSFKANTDDVRESPALTLIQSLRAEGAEVRVYDPAGMAPASRLLDGVKFARDAYACTRGAHAAVVLTDWPQFRTLDLTRLRRGMAAPVLIDLRNMHEATHVAAAGFTYVSVGRPAVWQRQEHRRFATPRRRPVAVTARDSAPTT